MANSDVRGLSPDSASPGGISPDSAPSHPGLRTRPKLSLLTMVRLGVFNMGLGIMSLLTLGILNRVMIDELKVPALVAAGAIAVHQFMAPARIWFGQMSDAKPLLGYHRSSYIWLGIVSMAITAFIAVQVVWQIGGVVAAQGWGPAAYPWVGLLAFVFALYGLALSSTSTPFTALLVDVSDDETQSQLVGIGWGMLMLGIITGVVITAIVLGSLGDDPSLAQLRASINQLFIIAPAIVCGLAVLSTSGIEKKYSRLQLHAAQQGKEATPEKPSGKEDPITMGRAFKVLTASRQTGLFFCFLLVLSLSLFMQDAVLEPYGGQVFGMKITETTQLNAFFGIGTLLGIIVTSFLTAPKPDKDKIQASVAKTQARAQRSFGNAIASALGTLVRIAMTVQAAFPRITKKQAVKWGCLGAVFSFVLLTLAGIPAQPPFLMGAVLCLGLAAGGLTTGSILLMLDLTIAETAGTFIGAWGLAQATARGGATVLGGAVLSLGKFMLTLFNGGVVPADDQIFPAYGLVFATQAVGMLVAIALLGRVNIREFQTTAQAAITAALEGDLD